MTRPAVTRRQLLQQTGVLIVGFSSIGGMADAANDASSFSARSRKPGRVDSWLTIARNGIVTVYSGKVDTGAGLKTAFVQIVADELDVPVEQVRMLMADTALTPDQGKSVASQGISIGAQPLRVAAAAARRALVDQAAIAMRVSSSELETVAGIVRVKAAPARHLSYGKLIGEQTLAINLELDRQTSYGPLLKVGVPLQSYKKRRNVGKPMPRLDVPAKATGTFAYVHNVRVPGMLHGRVIRPPAFGAKLISVDEASVSAIPHVHVVRRADFLGVVAEREEYAVKAAATLKATWSAGDPLPDQRMQYEDLKNAPVLGQLDTLHVGDVDAAFAGSKVRLREEYAYPYQMHAMLGPSCAVADVREDRATVWSGTQWPQGTQNDIAKMLGLATDNVRVIWHEASGSYGRLACDDAAADAALLSAAVHRPVRVQWMRHDEHGCEPISPAIPMTVEAVLDEAGHITAFSLLEHATSTAVAESGANVAWRLLGTAPGEKRLAGFPEDSPYDIPAQRFRVIYVKGPFRTLYLRAPGLPQSAFAIESFMDELAEVAGVNPVEFRLRHFGHPRDRDVFEAALRLSGWDGSRSPSRAMNWTEKEGRGVAHARWSANGTRVAAVAEIAVNKTSGIVRVKRLSIAHDCGLIINPDGALNQIQGGALQGISRTLHEQVRFDSHGITSLDWVGYPILRFSEVPEVKVTLIDRPDEPPSGAGESGTVPIAAAIANALYDATGKRLRELPFTPERIRAALA
jgi:nicotinate dehydrogenase subunit B